MWCPDVLSVPTCWVVLQGLAVLGHSLTALQVQPSAGWLRAYLAAADSTRVAATPAGCSYLMQTLGAWMQLGCLRPEQQQQPAAAGAVLQAAGAGRAGSSPVHALCAGAGGSGAGAGHSRREHLGAAAPGEQLQPMAHALAAQCIRCFMDQGHLFTAEQLGVFCKGLAQWGMQGTPQLAERFEQVSFGRSGQGRAGHVTTPLLVLCVVVRYQCRAASTAMAV